MRVHAGAARTLDRLDLSIGRKLHVRRPEERSARLATRDGHDHVVHQVLDEGARDDDADGQVLRVQRVVLRRAIVDGLDLGAGATQPLAGSHDLAVAAADVGVLAGNRQVADAAGRDGLIPGHVHVLVLLLVVDHHVARVLGVAHGRHLGRAHDVKLANLA